jgi:hypothetical protein
VLTKRWSGRRTSVSSHYLNWLTEKGPQRGRPNISMTRPGNFPLCRAKAAEDEVSKHCTPSSRRRRGYGGASPPSSAMAGQARRRRGYGGASPPSSAMAGASPDFNSYPHPVSRLRLAAARQVDHPLHSRRTPHPAFGHLLPIECGEGKSDGRGI